MTAARCIYLRPPGIGLVLILVELQPEVVQRIGAVVGVSDGYLADDLLVGRVEGGLYVVIRAVLPVAGAGRAEGGAGGLGGGCPRL